MNRLDLAEEFLYEDDDKGTLIDSPCNKMSLLHGEAGFALNVIDRNDYK